MLVVALSRGATVRLVWEESASVTNAAPIYRIARYRVWQGTHSRCYEGVTVPSPEGALTCTVRVDRAVTNYFAVTAVSNSGEESEFSEELVLGPRAAPRTNLVVTVVCGGETAGFTNPVDGPRWWTNATITKEYR